MSSLLDISIDLLDDHPDNSAIFGIDRDKLGELIESVKELGVLQPLLVEPKEGGRYTILAGHRRKYAAIEAGIKILPCALKPEDVNSDLAFTDTNLNFRELTPMQRARAIRHQKEILGITRGGDRTKEAKSDSRSLLERFQISKSTLHLYDKLNELIPEYQAMLDKGVISIKLGEKLASLEPEAQKEMFEFFGETIGEVAPEEVRKLREQNEKGFLVLEVMKGKIEELEKELKERREKEGDITDLETRLSALRSKKKEMEYQLIDTHNAAEEIKERMERQGAALLYLVEAMARMISGAKPKIETYLQTPMDGNTAANLLKHAQIIVEVGRLVETAAKKSLITVAKADSK